MIQFKIYTIPPNGGDAELEVMNKFLRQVRITDIKREFLPNGGWSFCISYNDYGTPKQENGSGGEGSAKEREQQKFNDLSTDQRQVYARLKEIRKAIGTKEGVSLFNVFGNVELMEIAALPHIGMEEIKGLKNIRKACVTKYAARLVEQLQLPAYEDPRPPYAEDNGLPQPNGGGAQGFTR